MRGRLAGTAICLALLSGGTSTARAAGTGCAALDYRSSLVQAASALHASPPDVAGAQQALTALLAVTPSSAVALGPVVQDLAATPPAIADASQRLEAMSATLAYPARSICNQDSSAARGTLRDVYASPAFRHLDDTPQQGDILASILRFLSSALDRAAAALGTVGSLLILLLILLIVAALLIAHARRRVDASVARAAVEPATLGDDPQAEWRAAETAAAAGLYRAAVRHAFRAALLDVAMQDNVFVDSAWTTRELLDRCHAEGDVLVALAAAAADFDRAWYSGKPVTAADWTAAAEHCGAVRQLAGRRRAAVG